MARGMLAIAESKEAAERQALDAGPVRVLRSREIDLSGLPPLASGPFEQHWVVVIEHLDPAIEATLPQEADPEEQCERDFRRMMLTMAVDPRLLIEGTIEEFSCPGCRETIRMDLPAPRDRRERTGAACPHCKAPLRRPTEGSRWELAPAKEQSIPPCLFCSADATSNEHAIPAWISRQLGVTGDLDPQNVLVAGRSAPPRRQPISIASHRARILCPACNTHFKHLEDEVIPLLVPMARGRVLSLGDESRQLLARWAHKTATTLLAATADLSDAVPLAQRHAIRHNDHAGDDTWISFFSWDGEPFLAAGEHDLADVAGDERDETGYVVVFAVAKMGFCVIGFAGLDPDIEIAGCPPPLLQVWPSPGGMQTWPPTPIDRRFLPQLLQFVPLQSVRSSRASP